MKKIIIILLAFALAIMTGCGAHNEEYKSSVPEKFLLSAENNLNDTTWVTVKSCDGTESYRIASNAYKYNYRNDKFSVLESFTHKQYVFDGKKYELIREFRGITTTWGCEDYKLDKITKDLLKMKEARLKMEQDSLENSKKTLDESDD